MEQRKRVVELAQEYEFPIVEDDAYGLLNYDGPSIPPLCAMSEGTVCYAGSLSKIFAPALRVGWIVAPEWIMPKLAILKESSDLDVATLGQRAATRMFDVIGLDAHLETLRSAYRARRDKMLDVLQAEMSEFASWHKPKGGFFIWVRLKDPVDTSLLLEQSMSRQNVAFMPGSAFSFEHGQRWTNCFRLSFSNLAPERIEQGVHRLAKCLQCTGSLYTLAVSNA
jgi:2-aminoadipate transaminase